MYHSLHPPKGGLDLAPNFVSRLARLLGLVVFFCEGAEQRSRHGVITRLAVSTALGVRRNL